MTTSYKLTYLFPLILLFIIEFYKNKKQHYLKHFFTIIRITYTGKLDPTIDSYVSLASIILTISSLSFNTKSPNMMQSETFLELTNIELSSLHYKIMCVYMQMTSALAQFCLFGLVVCMIWQK